MAFVELLIFAKFCLHNGFFSYDNDTKLDTYRGRICRRKKYLGSMIDHDGNVTN